MKIRKTIQAIICNFIRFGSHILSPLPIRWDNFATVVEKGKLATSFGNSLLYSAGAVILCVFFAAAAAYV